MSISQKIIQSTDSIIKKYGPRLTGSKACLQTADDLAAEAKTFANDVLIQDFKVHQGAFLGFIKIVVALYVIALLPFYHFTYISFALLTLALMVMYFQFLRYFEFIDIFYKKVDARNVIASVEPTDEVKQQFIVSGHHDSAHITNFYEKEPERYAFRVFSGFGFLIAFWLTSAVLSFVDVSNIIKLILLILYVTGFVFVGRLWFFANKKATPGAGDNLIASQIALEVARHFSENPLKHTRVIFASFDAEEAGLRGARAYAKAYKTELQKIKTYNFNMDCIYEPDKFMFLTTDINGSVKLSKDFSMRAAQLIEKKGFPVKIEPIAFMMGGTDAAELAKVGVVCASCMAMDFSNNSRSTAYHTTRDTVESVNPKAVELAYNTCVELAMKLDANSTKA